MADPKPPMSGPPHPAPPVAELVRATPPHAASPPAAAPAPPAPPPPPAVPTAPTAPAPPVTAPPPAPAPPTASVASRELFRAHHLKWELESDQTPARTVATGVQTESARDEAPAPGALESDAAQTQPPAEDSAAAVDEPSAEESVEDASAEAEAAPEVDAGEADEDPSAAVPSEPAPSTDERHSEQLPPAAVVGAASPADDQAALRSVGSASALEASSAARSVDARPAHAGVDEPQPERVYATAFLPGSIPSSKELSQPTSTNEVREFIRQAAINRNIDPDIAVRVALSEGGLTPATWTGDHGSSFGPYQLHYGGVATGGNSVAGLGDAFTSETGLRANDPKTWRQQIEWTLDHAGRSGWTPWHGAASVGIGSFEGISGSRTVDLRPGGGLHRKVDVPNQFAAQLPAPEAYAACGPVAAVAVARWLGRNPTVAEAVATAKRTGWTASGGMNGITNEKRLLEAMRVPVSLETSVNWRHVQMDASNGNPIIISTPQHYWVIDGFDSTSGKYHVGQSGLAYRGGAEWMSAAQIQQFGGPPNGALFVDHPLVPQPSIAAAPAKGNVVFDRWWEAERV